MNVFKKSPGTARLFVLPELLEYSPQHALYTAAVFQLGGS